MTNTQQHEYGLGLVPFPVVSCYPGLWCSLDTCEFQPNTLLLPAVHDMQPSVMECQHCHNRICCSFFPRSNIWQCVAVPFLKLDVVEQFFGRPNLLGCTFFRRLNIVQCSSVLLEKQGEEVSYPGPLTWSTGVTLQLRDKELYSFISTIVCSIMEWSAAIGVSD